MKSESTRYAVMPCPLGPMIVGGPGDRLEFMHLPESDRLASVHPDWIRDDAAFAAVRRELAAYFAGELRTFSTEYELAGTEFQVAVWKQLEAIPYGETRSYGEIAKRLGNPGASRAVGLANNANRLPIIVPCHRVIGADGAMVGFGGGLDAKQWLLRHEGIPVPSDPSRNQMGFAF